MTKDRDLTALATAIHAGRGVGTGDKYEPWIQITRRTTSPCSNLFVGPVPYLKRLTHFLSRGEREFALYLWWLGAEDVREQYPLWPWPHVHPEVQIAPRTMAKIHPGMEAVASAANIALRRYRGTTTADILTLDMMVTVPASVNPARLIGFSCKPRALVTAGLPTDRYMERIELDRRYCMAGDIPFHLVHPELLPSTLLVALHAVSPIEPRTVLEQFVASAPYRRYIEVLQRTGYDRPAWKASNEAGNRVGWSTLEEQRSFRIAIWYQHVDHDLSRGLITTRPLLAGGTALREEGRRRWFGEGA